ncbi:hypothetical protein RH915_10925 [Serpentinicella sp. ANB-PHB4]|uniref:hypothetical protein n=1 Tax=Serpentinicella sp. ANB-PHB4 TaxID=3074076 RepID=UPI0028650C17|nr:hypothetical protein [Serpentinicella sp. ANB-PHB4]MDR5660002.1 hypothetical protein [Serpentinicella sp. ANB-PHB4]
MSNLEDKDQPTEKKKISLQDAMKQMLENKKQSKGKDKSKSNTNNSNTKQSQHTKKTTLQRRKTGGA